MRLRGPRGCPWDRKQTLTSVRPFILEEAHEVVEAIDRRDPVHLREELGDVLFHVLFLAGIAEEKGWFGLAGVVEGITEKLVRRHPHVFGAGKACNPAEVERSWETLKAAEKGRRGSIGEGIPATVPALTRALRLGERAARKGFDWKSVGGILDKLDEETRELKQELRGRDFKKPLRLSRTARNGIEHELGDMLFVLTNLARHVQVDPEAALDACSARFCARFDAMREGIEKSGRCLEKMSQKELDAAWERAKENERVR
ncbi:MAG: nucleoside triphosphate pyrophosphohydrolase [Deltaproteobacteria bacterium]|nr:nucleoside triphosphate pyrophosphohydrolase [Deltaproteobacteria bacterium]